MGSMNVAAYSWNQQREVFVFWSMESKLRLQFPITTSAGRIATSRICIAGRRIRAGLTKNTKFADLIVGRSFTFQSVSRALSIRGGGPFGARQSSLAVQAEFARSGRLPRVRKTRRQERKHAGCCRASNVSGSIYCNASFAAGLSSCRSTLWTGSSSQSVISIRWTRPFPTLWTSLGRVLDLDADSPATSPYLRLEQDKNHRRPMQRLVFVIVSLLRALSAESRIAQLNRVQQASPFA